MKITDEGCVVKLCDLGMAVKMPEGRCKSLDEICGTCPFMAPEMLQNTGYDYKVDVWGLGATVYLMLFGQFPYNPPKPNVRDMKAMIKAGSTPISFRTLPGLEQPSDEACHFIKKLLDRSPES